MKTRLLIVGAGAHGKVVLDAALAQNQYEIVGFADETVAVGTVVAGAYKVIMKPAEINMKRDLADCYIVAIGDNKTRKRLAKKMSAALPAARIIHPFCAIGSKVELKEGVVILPGAVINFNTSIGKHAIVNSGVLIDHDCVIGDYVHLSFGTQVGSLSHIKGEMRTTNGQIIPSRSRLTK